MNTTPGPGAEPGSRPGRGADGLHDPRAHLHCAEVDAQLRALHLVGPLGGRISPADGDVDRFDLRHRGYRGGVPFRPGDGADESDEDGEGEGGEDERPGADESAAVSGADAHVRTRNAARTSGPFASPSPP